MARLKFGAFLAPHHPVGEHPMLMFRRDIEFAAHLDRLGFDEFWCGEHHSSGWETIGSPELVLAAAAEHTSRIRLGTGVISLPYHHPFNVAQRMVQLDHLSGGRAMFGSGPGALPSDAHTLGIDPMTQRDRQDEALGVIIRLLRGEERFSYDSDWFTLRDAMLQILPLQEDLPMVTASSISPSGMQIAGKHGIGVLSIASTSTEGIQALPTQWQFAEDAATKHGQTVDRANWRVMLSWHIAETREQAKAESMLGLQKWHNEYNVKVLGRPGAQWIDDPEVLFDQVARGGADGGRGGLGFRQAPADEERRHAAEDETDRDHARGQRKAVQDRPAVPAHVEQHDDEEEQRDDRARVDQQQQEGQEVGVERHEQPGDTDQ